MDNVHIGEIVSEVRTTDGGAGISPRMEAAMRRLAAAVYEEREQYKARVDAERRITGGVRDEMEGEV